MKVVETIEQLEVKTNKNYIFNDQGLTISNAQTFKERLLEEYTELVERIALLNKYLLTHSIREENVLLEKQLKAMEEYKGILQLRILEFMGGKTNEK